MESGAEIYRRYLGGDDTALAELVRAYRDGLILFVNRYTRSISVAEDIAEDVFLRLVTKKPRFRGETAFKTWLYTIGRNAALNYIKREGRTSSLSDGAPETADREDLEAHVLRGEKQIAVHRALDRLSPVYSSALYLKYFEELSNDEISAVLKKTKRQVENVLYQGKLALKKELEREGIDSEEL